MTKLNKYQQEIEQLLTRADKATDKALYGLYVDTIKDLKKALLVDWQRLGELSASEQLKLSRMTALLDTLEQSTADLKRGLKSEITGHLVATGKMAYNELFYEVESKYGGINFAMLKEEELRTIVETPVANYRLSDRLEGGKGVAESLRKNIKDDLTRVFLEGVSYQQASARLAELGYSSYRRALNITRTEAGRVQAVAREKSQQYAKSLGIEFDKVWVATLDSRTRHNHAMLDGEKPDEEGYFEINGLRTKQPHMFGVAGEDVNCRCRTISRLEGDDKTLLRRDNETGEMVEYKSYREWEKAKSELLERELSGKEFGVNLEYIRSSDYLDKLKKHPKTASIADSVAKVSRQMLQRRNGTAFEDYYLLDARTGKVVAVSNKARKAKRVVYNDQVRNAFKTSSEKGLISIHNHPSGYPPSLSDLASLQQRSKYNSVKYGLTAGHDGSVYWYSRPNKRIPRKAEQEYLNSIEKFMKLGYTEVKAQEETLKILSERFDFKFGRIE